MSKAQVRSRLKDVHLNIYYYLASQAYASSLEPIMIVKLYVQVVIFQVVS